MTPYAFFSFIIFICFINRPLASPAILQHPCFVNTQTQLLEISIHSITFHHSKSRVSLRKMAATFVFRFLSLLVIASSLALCAPLERPVFAAENSLEERNPVVIRGNRHPHYRTRSAVTNASQQSQESAQSSSKN